MKGCLKVSPIPSPDLPDHPSPQQRCHHRKCVAFGAAGSEEVYTADEWDRTPTEPARKLTYQDLLELKEIQRSLPRANQPCDVLAGRPSRHYLSTVPIGLLPLLPDGDATDTDSGGEGSSLTGSPMEGSRTGSPVPGACPGHGHGHAHGQGHIHGYGHGMHGYGYGYGCPPPASIRSAPRERDTAASPWRMNFHRAPAAPPPTTGSAQAHSYFPLVPMLAPEKDDSDASPTSPSLPAAPIPSALAASSPSITPPASTTTPISPPHLAYLSHLLPARPKPQRVRPRFDFLPLLETPPSSVEGSVVSSAAPSRAESPAPSPAPANAHDVLEPAFAPTPQENKQPHEDDHEHHARALHEPESEPEPEHDAATESDAGTEDGAPPTPSLTSASLDSSPRSRASSLEPREADFIHLAPHRATPAPAHPPKARARSAERVGRDLFGCAFGGAGFGGGGRRPTSVSRDRADVNVRRGYASAGASREVSRERVQVSALAMFSAVPAYGARAPAGAAAQAKPQVQPELAKEKPAKKRNFIVVNGIEIDLDDDDEEEEERPPAALPADDALSETGHVEKMALQAANGSAGRA